MSNTPTELSKEASDFLGVFAKYIQNNNAVTVGEWLFVCGSMAGIIISTQNLSEEEVRDSIRYTASVMEGVHGRLPSVVESNITQ
jgi:hypothetical protein